MKYAKIFLVNNETFQKRTIYKFYKKLFILFDTIWKWWWWENNAQACKDKITDCNEITINRCVKLNEQINK